MAENKKSFVLYADYIDLFEELSDDEAGKLIKHIFRYVNDQNPESPDRITKISFEPIKKQLKRDLKKWGSTLAERSNSGALGNLKRWNRDLYDKVNAGEMKIEEAIAIAKHRKTSHSDDSDRKPSQTVANVAVNVNDTVTVNVTDTVKRECADTHLIELNKSETMQMSFRRTVRGKFPVFTSSQFESIITGYLGYFDGKYPNGDTWNTFTKAFAWYISDLRQLPESVKKIKTLGE